MNNKFLEAKRNHHYVWAHYLARWSDDGKSVWHTTPTGKVNKDTVRAFAKEEYFYKAKELTPNHIRIIKHLSLLSPSHLQKLHMVYLSDHITVQRLETAYQKSGVKDQKVEEAFHALKCNIIENYHAAHESDARSIIDILVSGDVSVLDNGNNLRKFIEFLGHQISRTKSHKEYFRSTYPAAEWQGDTAIQVHNLFEDCWWFVSYMLGMNIGWSLYSSRTNDNHCLLINKTKTSFITSDQPVINVHCDLKEGEVFSPSDDTCDLFYPLSPDAAYMINKSDRFPQGVTVISEDFAKEMNEKISKASKSHIVGINRETVALYKKHVGKRQATVKDHFSL